MSIIRRNTVALTIGLCALAFPTRAADAQNVITVRPGAGGQITASPNTTVAIPIVIDMSAAGGTNLASLSLGVYWGPTRLTFDSLKAGTFGSITSNTSNAAAGELLLSVFDAAGTTSTVTIATAYFTASTGATSVTLVPSAAATELGDNLMSITRVRKLDACVALSGLWGDVNVDNAVNIIDAQQIARSTVALSVSNPAAVATQGDVTSDGVVNIVDAQQIARFSVGLSASARTNTTVSATPVVSTFTIPRVYSALGGSYLPSPLIGGAGAGRVDLQIGAQGQLDPVAKDANGVDISGCITPVYSTSDATLATVSASGIVTGLQPGFPDIVVTSGSGGGAKTVTKGFRVRGSMVLGATLDNAYKNVPFPIQPVLVFKTPSGDTATSINGLLVTASLVTGPGALGGTTSVPVVNGVATFSNLSATAEGVFALRFVATATPDVISNNFSVVSGPRLRVSTQPAGAATGAPFATQPVVELLDASGQLQGSDNSTVVTASVSSGTGTLSGTLTATVSGGIATFTNLTITGSGAHTLQFSTPATLPLTSSSFAVAAGTPTGLSMTRQPSGALNALPFSTQPEVRLVDASGFSAAGSNAVTASIASGTGTLSGTTTVNAVAGVASFTNLTITGSGAFTLTFSAAGLTPVTSASFSVLPAPPPVTSLAAGTHSCSHSSAGTYCWGLGDTGELGDGTTSRRATPAHVVNGDTIGSLVAGAYHTCGLTSAGAAYCWGRNYPGSVGNGTTTAWETTPKPVAGGLTFTSLSAGYFHTCGVTTSGAAYCWGSNAHGELGNGPVTYPGTDSNIPIAVPGGRTFAMLAAGAEHTCGVTTGNDMYCWGANMNGQLGNATVDSTGGSAPQLVAGGHQFVTAAAGTGFSCGLTSTGAAYCWGGNFRQAGVGYGTGDGTTIAHSVPTAVSGGFTFASISAGFQTICALTTTSTAYCWGSNEFGTVGDGATPAASSNVSANTRSAPTAVTGGLTFSSLSVGSGTACGISTAGRAYCWGRNDFGEVGDGTTGMRLAPTAVVYP